MNRNYQTPEISQQWASNRNTDMAVATAIHAVAHMRGGDRTPQEIWEAPTDYEWDHVHAAVEEYITHGDYPAAPDGRYAWGEETVKGPIA